MKRETTTQKKRRLAKNRQKRNEKLSTLSTDQMIEMKNKRRLYMNQYRASQSEEVRVARLHQMRQRNAELRRLNKPQPDLQYPSDEEQFSQSELVQLLKAAKLRVADLTRKNQELEKSVKKLSKEKMGLNNDLQVLQKLNEGLSKRCQRTEQRNYQLRQRLRQLGDTQSSPDEESDDDDEEPEHPQPTRRRKADDSDTTDQDDDNPEESQPFQDLLQISHEEDVKVLIGLPPQVVNRKKGGPAKRTRPTLSGTEQQSCSSLNARGQALTSFKVESLSTEEPSGPSASNKRTEPGVLGEPGGSNDPLSLMPVTEIKVEEIKIEVDDSDVFTVMDTM